MPKKDDITSTEKLLKLIRSKGAELSSAVEGSSKTQQVKKNLLGRKSSLGKKGKTKKVVKIGVDINASDITVAAVLRVSEKRQKLLEVKKIPYGPDIEKGSPPFTKLLKGLLKEFSGKYKNASLWATISSAEVETKFLQIPKIPARQIPNAVKFAFQKETAITETQIFDFQIVETAYKDGEQKKNVLAYTAPKNEVNSTKQLFAKAGSPLKGISIVPFAIQNLLRAGWLKSSGKNVCTLFIGSDWSRITIFSKGVLVLSRDIKAGARSMVQAIAETFEKERPPADPALALAAPDNEPQAENPETLRNLEKANKIFANFLQSEIPSPGARADRTRSDLKKERLIFGMFRPALDRVVRQLEMTIEHFELKFNSDPIDDVYVSGEISSKNSVVTYLGKQLGMPISQMDPFSVLPDSKPKYVPEGVPVVGDIFVPAAGMALSENESTPNFIFTYIHKAKRAFTKRFNQMAYSVFILLACIAMGVFYYQTSLVSDIKASTRPLQAELDAYSPKLERNLMASVTGDTVNRMKAYSAGADHYLPVALIAELLEITPENIKLASVQATLGSVASQQITKTGKTLSIEGTVSGNSEFFERIMTEYLVRLKKSPFFTKPAVKEKMTVEIDEKETLKFVVALSII